MEKKLYLTQNEFESIFEKHLKISTYSMSIRTLFGERLSKKIKYDPYYQRNYVWDKSKATFFIESILLGTDIPPLIFFNSGGKIEVIDGRQRFETIKLFKSNDITLALKGLSKLPQLQKKSFNKLEEEIINIFEDAKIRIFEFEVINKPSLENFLEDKVKKEIFRRYNSGITPLNTSEIDNAVYNKDDISNFLKTKLSDDEKFLNDTIDCFLNPKLKENSSKIEKTLQFLRTSLVLIEFPISAYAGGYSRTEIIELHYDFIKNNIEDTEDFCIAFIEKIKIIILLRAQLEKSILFHNKLIFQCIFWAINVIIREKSGTSFSFNDIDVDDLCNYYEKNIKEYSSDNSFYYSSIINRFKDTATYFSETFNVNFDVYLKDASFKQNIKSLRQSEHDAKLKLEELESLRANKPDPSVLPIHEIISELGTKRYLLRPSYQRQEKISDFKASSIIESIILGINLPPIFIFKNNNGVKEVVDGQQRLLSIIGFIGKKYQDENGDLHYTKNANFSLKNLKILKDFNSKKYNDLNEDTKDKILDFRLNVIEIDAKINPHFDPVDLFIRLNNKPFPIGANSFEMWNSFVDKDVVKQIKNITDKNVEWFFIKSRAPNKNRDRMQNEEMITMLSYMNYKKDYRNSLGVYQRSEKLNCRMREKKSISVLLESLSNKALEKKKFIASIENVELFILNLECLLGNNEKKNKLNELLSSSGRRSLVDFYMLYLMIGNIKEKSITEIDFNVVKNDMQKIQSLLRNTSSKVVNDDYVNQFHIELDELIDKYRNFG